MADTKVSALTELTSLAEADEFVVVDKSDTTMAATGTNKRVTRANLGFLGRKFRTGDYYNPDAYGNDTTVTLDLDLLRAVPFSVGEQQTFDRIGLEVTGAVASTTIRLGIYASNANGLPGALVLSAGSVDASTTGAKEITISQALDPGLYWVACVPQGGQPTVRATDGRTPYIPYVAIANQNYAAMGQGSVSGALPDPYSSSAGSTNGCPKIMMRAA